uniref:Uncharacterized protein n=1 Tax=Oryza nivara TaxID=4536 RepID=A0A0E0ITX0_ORYNI
MGYGPTQHILQRMEDNMMCPIKDQETMLVVAMDMNRQQDTGYRIEIQCLSMALQVSHVIVKHSNCLNHPTPQDNEMLHISGANAGTPRPPIRRGAWGGGVGWWLRLTAYIDVPGKVGTMSTS